MLSLLLSLLLLLLLPPPPLPQPALILLLRLQEKVPCCFPLLREGPEQWENLAEQVLSKQWKIDQRQ